MGDTDNWPDSSEEQRKKDEQIAELAKGIAQAWAPRMTTFFEIEQHVN